MSQHLNAALRKSLTTAGDYALATRGGRVVRFQKAEQDDQCDRWLLLRARPGLNNGLMPWVEKALGENGIYIRIDEISWSAEL